MSSHGLGRVASPVARAAFASSVLVVASAALAWAAPTEPNRPGDRASHAITQAACDTQLLTTLDRSSVQIGEPIVVTHDIAWTCTDFQYSVVLVLDGSAEARPALDAQQAAARDLVASVLPTDTSNKKVAIVEYAEQAAIRCALTGDRAAIDACIAQLGSAGPSRPDTGLAAALDLLSATTATDREIVIVFAASTAVRCDVVIEAGSQLKKRGSLVVSVCPTATCDTSCMRRTATSPRYFFESGAAVAALLPRVLEPAIPRRLTITDTLPAGFEVVPDSLNPDAEVAGRDVTWTLDPVPDWGGSTQISYSVRPYSVGPQRLPERTEIATWQPDNQRSLLTAAGAEVDVLPARVFLPDARTSGP